MDLAQWWAAEARHQHCASKDAQCHSGDELELFHRIWKLDRFTEGPFTSFTERPFVTLTEGPFTLFTERPLVTLAE